MFMDDFLIRSTIRIVAYNGEQSISTGTSFFYNYEIDGSIIPVLITNAHVVKGFNNGKLEFSILDENQNIVKGKKYTVTITDFEKAWIFHPENVDLCILPLATIYDEVFKNGIKLALMPVSKDSIVLDEESEDFSKIEEIYIVGYPDGIIDSYNNLPIVRRGITATPIQYDFNEKKEFLIDAAIFGGSSGSPVYIYNNGIVHSKSGISFGANRLKLVGIVHAVFQHQINGEMVCVDIPTSKKIIPTNLMPNNIGCVIKASRINDFIEPLKKRLNDSLKNKNDQVVDAIED